MMFLTSLAGVLQFFLDGLEPDPIYYFGSCFLSNMVIAYLIYINSKPQINPYIKSNVTDSNSVLTIVITSETLK